MGHSPKGYDCALIVVLPSSCCGGFCSNYQCSISHDMCVYCGFESGLWESVDDFQWLQAVQSPNWSVLPSDQRISMEGPSQLEAENGP